MGPTYGWSGRQLNFNRSQMGIEDGGLGDSGEELTGVLIAGNDFNYVQSHAEALAASRQYNIISCSSQALEAAQVAYLPHTAIDLLLGLERNDGHSLEYYKTFTPAMQHVLQNYTSRGGRLLVSGAYVGSDMMGDGEQQFLRNVLKCQYTGRNKSFTDVVFGLNTSVQYWNKLNEEHYAATSVDILQPVGNAYTAMQYANGHSAAVAYKGGDYATFVMGFPLECIRDEQQRASIMQGIMNFLIHK
jgi:hypothetical protein